MRTVNIYYHHPGGLKEWSATAEVRDGGELVCLTGGTSDEQAWSLIETAIEDDEAGEVTTDDGDTYSYETAAA